MQVVLAVISLAVISLAVISSAVISSSSQLTRKSSSEQTLAKYI